MEISRNKANELALNIIYSILLYQEMETTFDIKETIENQCEDSFENIDLILKDTVVKGYKYQNEIKTDVSKYLINWNFDRLSLITQACFIFAYAIYKYGKNVDKSIAIDVCMKYSKKYGDKDEYKFINAVLDKAL